MNLLQHITICYFVLLLLLPVTVTTTCYTSLLHDTALPDE